MARNRKGEVINEAQAQADEQAYAESVDPGNAKKPGDSGTTAVLDSAGNTLVPGDRRPMPRTADNPTCYDVMTGRAAIPESNGDAVKPTETKEARFRRLANKRFPRAVKALKALTNLSNRAQYAYTEAQAETLLAKVFAAVDEMQAKFRGATVQADSGLLFE